VVSFTVADFLNRISEGNPGFRCYACGDFRENCTFMALVSHALNPSSTPPEVAMMESALGNDDAGIRAFYSRHNGATFYRDSNSDAAGIRLFPIQQWSSLTHEIRAEFTEFGLGELYGDLMLGVVIGEVCRSGNYFFYQTAKNRLGQIIYLMHDPAYDKGLPFDSFADLLGAMVDAPAQLLYVLGCYTRYSDGTTATQWIPKQFVANAANSAIE
jgi:hypothetical protein